MFEDNLIINGNELTKKYIESLDYNEREELIEPIFSEFRRMGFLYPDNKDKVDKEYKRICNNSIDIAKTEVFNNSNVGTYICKYFCKTFYETTEMKRGKKSPNMIELFNDDDVLKKIIRNRLGLNWYKQKGEHDVEAFRISHSQIVQGMRSTRTVPATSMFKPDIAKYFYERYSNVGDVVYDYSMGFGGRLLGAMASNRRYVGVDPLTYDELCEMKDYFGFTCNLNKGMSEEFDLGSNTIDFAFSSPPYEDLEVYSEDETQAYNKGSDYFYDVYWTNTLKNIKNMLRSGKFFVLNITKCPKMLEMAREEFGFIEKIDLRTVRSHLNKTAGVEKFEGAYVFKK